MLYIGICDDERDELDYLNFLLEKYCKSRPAVQIKVEQFETATELLAAVEAGRRFDIYLLDVYLPDMIGTALAGELRLLDPSCFLIFLTNSKAHAVEAFSVRAVNYMLKPVSEGELFRDLDNLCTFLGEKTSKIIFIQTFDGEIPVRFSDILYVKAEGHALRFVLTEGANIVSKIYRVSLEQAVEELATDARFLRTHRSYLVNAMHIKRFSKEEIILAGEEHVPFSRLRYQEVKQQYMQFLSLWNYGDAINVRGQ